MLIKEPSTRTLQIRWLDKLTITQSVIPFEQSRTPPLLDGVADGRGQPSPEQQEDSMHTDTRSRIISVDGDIIIIDFDAVQGMTPEEPLRFMIATGNYNWASPDITPDRFPVEGTGIKRFRPKLFGPHISLEDAVEAMKTENFTPGDHVQGLAFGSAFPKVQLQHRIACLGSSALVVGDCCVVCLSRDGAERGLGLSYRDDGFDDFWRFLGVQEGSVG